MKISPSSLQESPSSLQGALKKRSAFEDLTNVSMLVQSFAMVLHKV